MHQIEITKWNPRGYCVKNKKQNIHFLYLLMLIMNALPRFFLSDGWISFCKITLQSNIHPYFRTPVCGAPFSHFLKRTTSLLQEKNSFLFIWTKTSKIFFSFEIFELYFWLNRMLKNDSDLKYSGLSIRCRIEHDSQEKIFFLMLN